MTKKIISVLLATVIVIGGSIPVFATPNNQELNSTRQKYAKIEQKISEIENKIYDLDLQIEPLQVTVGKNNREIKGINESITNTTEDIEQTKGEIETLDKALGQRVKSLRDSGNLEFSYLNFLFEADSTSDFFSRMGAIRKVVSKDKEAIQEVVTKKEELNEKVNSLEEKKTEIDKLNEETKKVLAEFDVKKKEAEKLNVQLQNEKSKFDAEYLSKAEREVVEPQFAVINNSNSSISQLQSVITQLRSVRDHQIKSPTVVKEINTKIEKAKIMLKTKKAEEAARKEAEARARAAASKTPSRGNDSVSVPSAPRGNVQSVLNLAYSQLGKPYVYGATGASTFDCSGFTQYVYRNAAGVDISRTTYSQINVGKSVNRSQLQPGDLVFPHSGHVGIYVGNGKMIHAPQTGDVVKVAPVYKFYAARRIL